MKFGKMTPFVDVEPGFEATLLTFKETTGIYYLLIYIRNR